jgi:pantoate--beta-alanine ligase
VTRILELRGQLAGRRAAGERVALVPTMGALHEGHLALVDRARQLADVVVVSVFVNPLQFGKGEDLDRYPRSLDGDLAALAGRAELVFAPSVDEMYPQGASETRVVAGPVGELFEGAARPGHFDGVLTVVAKLFGIVRPDVALFGQKDAQQLFLVTRMARDLDLDVSIEPVPTVRGSDGLALSSRNRFLAEEERESSVVLSAALAAAADAGPQGADAAVAAGRAQFAAHPDVRLDYLVVVDPDTFRPVPSDFRGPALAIVAAELGTTRLIDNGRLVLNPPATE